MTDRPDDHDEDREAALLDYAKGTLSVEATRRLEDRAAQDPHLAAELKTVKAIRATLIADEVPVGDLSWARLSRAIDAEPVASAAPDMVPPANDSPPLTAWFKQKRSPLFALGFAAAAVLVWQTAISPVFNAPATNTGNGGYVTATAPEETPSSLRVLIVPTAKAGDFTDLLTATGGTITDGPNAIGFYTIQFEDDTTRDAALDLFATRQDVIEAAQSD